MPRGVYTRSPEHLELLRASLPHPNGEDNPRWSGDAPTKKAAHKRLAAARGSATLYACVDCGNPAQQWSYVEPYGFSTNLDDYSPRCQSCHKAYDRRLMVDAYLRDLERRNA